MNWQIVSSSLHRYGGFLKLPDFMKPPYKTYLFMDSFCIVQSSLKQKTMFARQT